MVGVCLGSVEARSVSFLLHRFCWRPESHEQGQISFLTPYDALRSHYLVALHIPVLDRRRDVLEFVAVVIDESERSLKYHLLVISAPKPFVISDLLRRILGLESNAQSVIFLFEYLG